MSQTKNDELWSGIVIRTTPTENGTIPRIASAASPDIIISPDKPIEDISWLTDSAKYNEISKNDLHVGWPNYIYARGRNYTSKTISGNWNMFYATPNILLYPHLWMENKLATCTKNTQPEFTIKGNEIGASIDAFIWEPKDISDHYCLIAMAVDPEHPNPVAGRSNITDLAEFMVKNGNIAQRNLHLVRDSRPTKIYNVRYTQGEQAALVDLSVVFKNIPLGSSYAIGSSTPVQGGALYIEEKNVIRHNFKHGWTNITIPADWETSFSCAMTFGPDWKGIPEGEDPTIEIRAELIQTSSDRLYHLCSDADPHPVTGHIRMDESGLAPVRVITAGSVTATFIGNRPE